MSLTRLSIVGSRRVRVPAIGSPDWRAVDSAVLIAAGVVLTTIPELMAPPRRGLWQPSQVRRSPGRTWIQLVWVWNASPFSLTTARPIGVSAGTVSLNEPSGSIGA